MAAVHDNTLAVIYRTGNSVEAHALAGHLTNAGVGARVVGDFLDTAYAGLQLGGHANIEVWVPNADRVSATSLAAAWLGERQAPPPEVAPAFRFSMMTALVVLTLAAVFCAAAATGSTIADGALVTFQLLLIGAAALFVLKRMGWPAKSRSNATRQSESRDSCQS